MAAPPRTADARLAVLGTVAAAVAVTSWGIGPVVAGLSGERVRPAAVAWPAVAIRGVGMGVFAWGWVEGRSRKGDVLAPLALGAGAWYFVAVKQARRHFAALEYQTALAIVAAVVVCPVALASGQSLHVPNGHTWVLLTITIVLGATGHFIMNWAHAR